MNRKEMGNMRKWKFSILSMVLYVLAGLLIGYTIWSAFKSHDYISEMIEMDQLAAGQNMYEIVNFYMTNCTQYAVFAVILFTLGWILDKKSPVTVEHLRTANPEDSSKGKGKNKTDEDDFEKWFQNNDK